MNQAQTAPREGVEWMFKRFILDKAKDFEQTPQADLFRVNLLGQMLDRHDEMLAKGMDEEAAAQRVMREYFDIPEMMREQGFAERFDDADEFTASRWPQITEDEAAQYIRESDEKMHRTAIGAAMCASCVFPILLGAAFDGLTSNYANDVFTLIGLVGMFAMIAVGVYSITTAKKPKKADAIKKGRFALGQRLRKKLMQLREAIDEKARRRKGKGIAMLVGCVAPIFVGAALDSLLGTSYIGSPFSGFGVAGMFVLIGMGVYEVIMADGEKKSIKQLLDDNRKK